MPLGFAQREIADAAEAVEDGNYETAARYVRNAKRDIEDHARDELGANKEEFDKCCENIRTEVKKSNPSTGQLRHVIKRMRKFLEKMENQEEQRRNY